MIPQLTPASKTIVLSSIRPIVMELVAATTVYDAERERMDNLYNAILQEKPFYKRNGERLFDHDKAYLMEEKDMNEFFILCQEARTKAGCKLPDGYCPALVAHSTKINIENKLLKKAGEVLNPVFSEIWNMDYRRKAIDLLCQLALAA